MTKYCYKSWFYQICRPLHCNFTKNEIIDSYFSKKKFQNASGSYRFLKRLEEFLKNLAESSLVVASLITLTFPSTHEEDTDLGLLNHAKLSFLWWRLPVVNYYQKASHLECCTSPRSASAIGFIKEVIVIFIVILWKVSRFYLLFSINAHFSLLGEFVLA